MIDMMSRRRDGGQRVYIARGKGAWARGHVMRRRYWEKDFSQDPLCRADVGREGLSWGLGSGIPEGGCSVWDHSVRLVVCVRANRSTVTRVSGCCAGFAESVPRRKWRSNQVGSGAVDSRPVATLKRENTEIRRHRGSGRIDLRTMNYNGDEHFRVSASMSYRCMISCRDVTRPRVVCSVLPIASPLRLFGRLLSTA